MNVEGFVLGYSLAGLAIMVVLIIAARRSGRWAAAWLIVLGLIMLGSEESLLTLFWAVSSSDTDPDGMANLITTSAQAHVLDSAIFATALLVGFGWLALTALRRGERWAAHVLLAGWVVVAATMVVTSLAVYGRGFGWAPLTVGLMAWASGLWLARPVRESVRSGQ